MIEETRLSYAEFTQLAILKLRQEGYDGIHVVYSGFNEAFREYFPGVDPKETLKKLADEGVIHLRPAKGGAVIGLPDNKKPADSQSGAAKTLAKMGIKK